jgi:hypothetical protein
MQENDNNLELNVLRNGILGYKHFDLRITTSGQRGHMTWRLDCPIQDGDDSTRVETHNKDFGGERKMKIKYLVMSHTVKAKVVVMLRHRGDLYRNRRLDGESKCTVSVYDEIAARIDGYDHRIVLFRINAKSKAADLVAGSTIRLERSDVWVPHGKRLHIEIKQLHVTAGDRVVRIASRSFSFNFGDWSPTPEDSDSEVKVEIDWHGIRQKEVINIQNICSAVHAVCQISYMLLFF